MGEVVRGQTLDLSAPERPELGVRSIIERARRGLMEAIQARAEAEAERADAADAEATTSPGERAAEAARLWDGLALLLLERAASADDAVAGELAAVVGLTMVRGREAAGRAFAAAEEQLSDDRDAAAGVTRGLRRLRVERFVVQANALRRSAAADGELDAAWYAELGEAAEEVADLIEATDGSGGWRETGDEHEKSTSDDEVEALLSEAGAFIDKLGEWEIEAAAAERARRYVDVLEAAASFDVAWREPASERARRLRQALELPSVVRTTRWAGRSDVERARAMVGDALGEGGGFGGVHERLTLLARTAALVGGVERLRRERVDTAGGEAVSRAVLRRVSQATTRWAEATAAGDERESKRSGERRAAERELADLGGALAYAERVVGLMEARRAAPELAEVDDVLRPVWRVLEEATRDAENRAFGELGSVMEQRPPTVGPAGVSLLASLRDRVERLELLAPTAERARALRRSDDAAEAAAGERLWSLLLRAGDAAGDRERLAAFDESLAEARAFVRTLRRIEALERDAAWQREDGRSVAEQFGRVTLAGPSSQVDARLRAATERTRDDWLRGWASAGGEGGAAGAEQRTRATLRLDALERVSALLTLRHAVDTRASTTAAHPAVSLGMPEVEHALQAASLPLLTAAGALGAEDLDRALGALERAEEQAAVLRALRVAGEEVKRLGWRGTTSEERGASERAMTLADVRGLALLSAVVGDAALGLDDAGGAELLRRWREVAAVSRWTAERAAVARSIDPTPLGEVEAYLVELAEGLRH